jgi:hypothetical protein
VRSELTNNDFTGTGGAVRPDEQVRSHHTNEIRRVTTAKLAEAVQVDAKAVERWIVAGRVPYRKHRYNVDGCRSRAAGLWRPPG